MEVSIASAIFGVSKKEIIIQQGQIDNDNNTCTDLAGLIKQIIVVRNEAADLGRPKTRFVPSRLTSPNFPEFQQLNTDRFIAASLVETASAHIVSSKLAPHVMFGMI